MWERKKRSKTSLISPNFFLTHQFCTSNKFSFSLLSGMMISSAFWGTLADKYGRKSTLIWTSIFLCYFGFLTSFSPSFHWVLFLRFLVGFFIGGVPQVIIYHSIVVKNYYLELSHSRKNHFQFCRFFFFFFFFFFL